MWKKYCPRIMCILIFPSKIWAKTDTLYMAKYSIIKAYLKNSLRKKAEDKLENGARAEPMTASSPEPSNQYPWST